jgi:hypothetical protein
VAAEVVSKPEFGAKHGVGDKAVHNWIARGILSGHALTDDGRINVEEADRQLTAKLDLARSTASVAPAAQPSINDQLKLIDLEQKRRHLAADRGVYVRTDGVDAGYARGFGQFLAAADIWLNDVAGELGLSGEGLATLRASWRTFREREADAALAFAGTLPEVLPDAP